MIQARDGLEALALVRERKPDILLLDLHMPGMNGLDVLKNLLPELPRAGFLMVTGNEDEVLARECLENGAFDYVPKPVKMDSLLLRIRGRLLIQKGV